MEKLNPGGYIKGENPSLALAGRICASSPENFIAKLEAYQIAPCPWGDLGGKTRGEVRNILQRKICPPLVLELGCGVGFNGTFVSSFFYNKGRILFSDYLAPNELPQVNDDYVQIDLRKPEQINLGGMKVHWIGASMVFTKDEYGVRWRPMERGEASLGAIQKLLLPNGIFYVYPASGLPLEADQYAAMCDLNIFRMTDEEILFQKKEQ